MWVTETEFKDRTKICGISGSGVEELLLKAKQEVINFCFVKKTHSYTTLERSGVNYIKLEMHDMYVQDTFSYDAIVDEKDINIYELNTINYDETNLSGSISGFKPKYGYIELYSGYPTDSDHKLYVEYYLGRYPFDVMYPVIKDLQIQLALRSLLQDKPMAAAVAVTNSWAMNGVTFDGGAGSTNVFFDNITKSINKLIFDLQPLRIQARDIVRYDNPYIASKF